MKRFSFFIVCIICLTPMLYSNVSIKSYVDKKSIFHFQNITYTIELTGEYQTFSFDGINENVINDFDVVDKNIESTIIHSDDYKSLVLNKKIIYTMKPISKGTLRIPAIDIKYFTIDDNKVLTENNYKLDSILIRIHGNAFLIFTIVACVLLIVIISVMIFAMVEKYRKNKL